MTIARWVCRSCPSTITALMRDFFFPRVTCPACHERMFWVADQVDCEEFTLLLVVDTL